MWKEINAISALKDCMSDFSLGLSNFYNEHAYKLISPFGCFELPMLTL